MASLLIVAGDPSGDARAAQLFSALSRRLPGTTATALGGPRLKDAGATLLDDLTETASIGPFDASRHLGRFLRAKQLLERHLRNAKPDLAILVDFGDFNLPVVAPLVKQHQIPIVYYISPQVWAWGGWRLRPIRRFVDRMVVFFPFEETFYRQHGIAVTWVGHPLLDEITSINREEAQKRLGLNPWRMTVGLLPGSRPQEVRRHLPLLLKTASRIAWHMPGVQFVLPKAPGIAGELIRAAMGRRGQEVIVWEGNFHEALSGMDAAIVSSGTATLEAALCGVPMVVVYRTSWLTYLAARAVVRVPHIAMVNLIVGKGVVPEFIQHRASPRRIAGEVVSLLRNGERRASMQRALGEVKERLGLPGAVERATAVVLEYLNEGQGV